MQRGMQSSLFKGNSLSLALSWCVFWCFYLFVCLLFDVGLPCERDRKVVIVVKYQPANSGDIRD